jgi:hypothetical protein
MSSLLQMPVLICADRVAYHFNDVAVRAAPRYVQHLNHFTASPKQYTTLVRRQRATHEVPHGDLISSHGWEASSALRWRFAIGELALTYDDIIKVTV